MGTEAEVRRFEAVVLAAGRGSRFGGAKLTAPYGDGVLLDGALAAAFAAPVRHVAVVMGADSGVARAAARVAERLGQTPRLRLVAAPDHADGLAASLRAGIASLPSDAQGAFVFLGDMPRIPFAILEPLADAIAGGAPAAAPVFDDLRGHPAVFASRLFPKLRDLMGDSGAKRLLDRLGREVVRVPAPDDGVLFDVDTPADLSP